MRFGILDDVYPFMHLVAVISVKCATLGKIALLSVRATARKGETDIESHERGQTLMESLQTWGISVSKSRCTSLLRSQQSSIKYLYRLQLFSLRTDMSAFHELVSSMCSLVACVLVHSVPF